MTDENRDLTTSEPADVAADAAEAPTPAGAAPVARVDAVARPKGVEARLFNNLDAG